MNKKNVVVIVITFILSVFLYGLIDSHFFYISEWDIDTVINFIHLWLTLLTSYFLYNFLLLKAFQKLNLKSNLHWIVLLSVISGCIFLYVLFIDIFFYKFYYGITSLREETTFYDYDLPIIATILLIGSTFFYQKYYNKPIGHKPNNSELPRKQTEKLKIEIGNKTQFINTIDVGLFYTEEGFVWLELLNGSNFHTNFTLSYLSETLNDFDFFRLNRQVIISRLAIISYKKLDYQKLEVELKGTLNYNQNLVVSKYNASDFKKWLAHSG